MRCIVWPYGSSSMPSVRRSDLIPVIHEMIEGQGFAGRIGQAALVADEENLEILVKSFPKLFKGKVLKKPLLRLVKG